MIFFSDFYINDILSGGCEPNNKPEILKETASTAWIDAKNVLGATSSHFAMDIAMTKARQTGVAWVVLKGKYDRRARTRLFLCDTHTHTYIHIH